MKVRTSHSNLEIEIVVRSNDKPVQEFMLGSRPTNNNDKCAVKECYVPLVDGQGASVYTWFSGHVCNARYDLYIDGTYYGSKDIIAGDYGAAKEHKRRRAEFRGVQAVILAPGEDPSSGGQVVDAELVARQIDFYVDPARLRNTGRSFGVGSIVVTVSCETQTWERSRYKPDSQLFPDYFHRNWQHRAAIVQDPTIPADQYMDLKNVYAGIINQKANRFKAECDAERNGTSPTATLVFYYRSKEALLAGRCIPAPDRAWLISEQAEEVSPVRTQVDEDEDEDEDEDPNDDIDSLLMQLQSARPRDKNSPLTLSEVAATTSFHDFVINTETARESLWRSKGYTKNISVSHNRRQQTLSKLRDDGVRDVVLGDKSWPLPQKHLFRELINPEGTPLLNIVSLCFPGCQESLIHKAIYILAEHLQDIASIIEDDRGQLLAINHQPSRHKRAAPSEAERNISKRVKPDPSMPQPQFECSVSKRVKFDLSMPPPAFVLPGQASKAEIKKQALKRKHWLEEEARRVDAMLEDCDEDDNGSEDAEDYSEMVITDNVDERSQSTATAARHTIDKHAEEDMTADNTAYADHKKDYYDNDVF